MDKTRGALLVFMPLLVFLPATLALSNLREVVGLALAKTNNCIK